MGTTKVKVFRVACLPKLTVDSGTIGEEGMAKRTAMPRYAE